MLADMGAEVIRVERPGGEEDRRIGLTASNGENFVYLGLARNKKAVTLDVRTEEGSKILHDLVRRADVFLHNFSFAAAKTMKLAYNDIRLIKPDIIYTGISCYGSSGPYADRIGFDPIAQVSSGAAALTGFERDVPLRCGVPWVDYSTGLCAALGTVLALRHRDASGEGQAVDCSLLQTAISFTTPMIAEAVIAGKERPRLGNRGVYVGPADLYRCRDGFVYAATITESMWRSLRGLVPELQHVPLSESCSGEERFENNIMIDPIITRWMAARTVNEVIVAFGKAHIPCGAYLTTVQVPDDPQVRACNMIEYLDLDIATLNSVPVSGLPIRLSRTPGAVTFRPPRVGEHNRDIYADVLGYTEQRIAMLIQKGVV